MIKPIIIIMGKQSSRWRERGLTKCVLKSETCCKQLNCVSKVKQKHSLLRTYVSLDKDKKKQKNSS